MEKSILRAFARTRAKKLQNATNAIDTHFQFFFLDDGTNNRLKVSRTCDVNLIDKPQHCVCEAGKRISVFNSTHSNNEEDRVWRLQCAGIPKYGQMWVSFTH